ncbi:hypothetical protein C0J52_03698 [Blattella germanica]|nr:hypothetical protein C0J52_03698 [Blattella germanica]
MQADRGRKKCHIFPAGFSNSSWRKNFHQINYQRFWEPCNKHFCALHAPLRGVTNLFCGLMNMPPSAVHYIDNILLKSQQKICDIYMKCCTGISSVNDSDEHDISVSCAGPCTRCGFSFLYDISTIMPKYCIIYSTRKKSGNKNEEEQYHAVRTMKVLALKRDTKHQGPTIKLFPYWKLLLTATIPTSIAQNKVIACKTQKNYKHFQFTPVVPSSPTRCSPSSASSFGIVFVVMIGLVPGSGIFQPYGPVCPIECIGHIQKQMGSWLLKLTKDMKGRIVFTLSVLHGIDKKIAPTRGTTEKIPEEEGS